MLYLSAYTYIYYIQMKIEEFFTKYKTRQIKLFYYIKLQIFNLWWLSLNLNSWHIMFCIFSIIICTRWMHVFKLCINPRCLYYWSPGPVRISVHSILSTTKGESLVQPLHEYWATFINEKRKVNESSSKQNLDI